MEKDEILQIILQADVEKTRTLNLANRDINELPFEIERLKNLEELDLSYNNIEALPESISNCLNLKRIWLQRNKLQHLPESICRLTKLESLDASYNLLTGLPDAIGELENLQNLDLGNNTITALPLSMTKLLRLKKLFVEENPFEFPPLKIIQRGLYSTMFYLAEESKRKETIKVSLQVFNLPSDLQVAFTEYVDFFKEIINNPAGRPVTFNVKYGETQPSKSYDDDSQGEMGLNYFLRFIRENLSVLKRGSHEEIDTNLFELQLMELRNEINRLNESLGEKISEIHQVQNKLSAFANLLKK